MSYCGRTRGVYAGLLAALGVTAALVAAPVVAYADEQGPVVEGESAIESRAPEQSVTSPESTGPSSTPTIAGGSQENSTPDLLGPDQSLGGAEGEENNEESGSQEDSQQGSEIEGDALNQPSSSEGSTDGEASSSTTITVSNPQLSALNSEQNALMQDSEEAETKDDASNDAPHPESGWVVRDAGDGSGLQRYYLVGGVAKTDEAFRALLGGVESWFYALSDGRVVRDRVTIKKDGTSYTYLADNDGRLLDPGWHVTDQFDQGLQRYYVDADEHACVEGYSSDGWGHYTRPEGYVVRGKYDTGRGTVALADNNGRTVSVSGWLVTGAYDGGVLQRYFLNGEGQARSSYFSVEKGWYYGIGGEGYVLRGVGVGVDGSPLIADNDGRLAEGWVVTDVFGQGLQRYWFVNGRIPDEGIYRVDSDTLTCVTKQGYVLRGGGTADGKKYFADNDGRVLTNQWIVTGDFTGGNLERYWATSDGSFRTSDEKFNPSDFFDDGGWLAYALSDGTIFRGKHDNGNGTVYLADNDGRISDAPKGWLITGIYDGGTLQRYYMNGDGTARSGFFVEDGNRYFGMGGNQGGYVLRGTTGWYNYVLLANNDGVMPETEGWLISDAYGQGAQRYMIDEIVGQNGCYGALTGYFSVDDDGTADTSGKDYYGRSEGYVVRGFYLIPGTDTLLYANNDGVLQPLTESPIVYNILKRIFWTSSQTQYLIGVDVESCWVVVFQGSAGNWNPIHVWRCTTGRPSVHEGLGTPRGDYMIGYDGADYNWSNSPYYVYSSDRYRTEYWAHSDVMYFTGFCLNLGFHSTKRVNGGFSDDGGQLGNRLSDGCIRLAVDNAKWIFDNCMPGTHVTTI